MSMTLEEALSAALDDEYRARATYSAVLDAHGPVRPFVNIVESEERHIDALRALCDQFGVSAPPDPWSGRVPAPPSLAAACEAAIEAERENEALYVRLLDAAREHPEVEAVFRRLLAASRDNHLPAFERALARELGDGNGGRTGRGRGPGGGHGRHRHRGGRDRPPTGGETVR
jgi:hypothetical protein